MIRLQVAYAGTVECRTYKTLKAAKRAFANRMLSGGADAIFLSVNSVHVAAWAPWEVNS